MAKLVSPDPDTQPDHLRAGLNDRKMTMIAIGGVIGAGLFVGSGSAIQIAGPATLIAYIAIGALVVLVMRMLGEMAVHSPESGSFSSYATRYLGPWAGVAVGWLYAYQWCITIGFEAVVGAAVTHQMIPAIPTWLAALVYMAALIMVNFTRVENFGSFEFWFASIKVAAIVLFLLLGIVTILGFFPGVAAPGFTNLTGHGGFAPNGWMAVLTASLVVFFSFFGTEVVTIAAGEAANPVEAVKRGINSVVWRILLFYIGSILIIVTLLPWNSTEVAESPYSAVLEGLKIPYVGTAMNVIVLVAVLSCLNAGIYASSRMLFSLGARGEGPRILRHTSRSGTPYVAVLAASSVGLLTVVANYFLPTAEVYKFLLDSCGAVAVVVYFTITVTHIRSRMNMSQERRDALQFKMWLFPYLDVLVLAALFAVIVGMVSNESSQRSALLTALVTAIAIVAGLILQRRMGRRSVNTDVTATSADGG